ncbi:class F sortase [Streptomyces sp. NBC_00878]|uniref:class F sortase n=1 Tax=Streptomyces sp. NBC_00878 TaxID=2975854 RepID=UPI002257F7F9|nr:class F sortase [Streptomyces sp. NBC_00878]MCX4907424.1 class F sortase [Streptomyces sp. NBC_00878]
MAVRPSSPADKPGGRPVNNEPDPTEQGSRTKVMVIGAAAALVLAVSLFGGNDTPSGASGASGAAHASASAPPAGQPAGQSARQPERRAAGKHLPRSKPLRLLIPKIFVDAPFMALAIGRNGQLEPPPADDINLVGWHAEGPSPGETGTSVIAGHVDTAKSPAVFANLGGLAKGDSFSVKRADGSKASFVVDSVETFDKEHFPSKRVYGDTARAQVRLITCAGDYDRTAKDYTENLVVFAHLA